MKELSVYPVIYDQKVAWGDMDAFGHVNNVQYYRYIESSRILYMENVNILTPNIYTVVASKSVQIFKTCVLSRCIESRGSCRRAT